MLLNKRRSKTIITLTVCLIVVSILGIVLYNRPKKIQRTMSGIILDKKSKTVVGKTSVSIDLKHYKGSDAYKYKGKMEFQDVSYTNDKDVNIDLFDGKGFSSEVMQEYDTKGSLSYVYSQKVGERYELLIKNMQITVADADLSKFAVTYFDKENTLDNSDGNDDVVMVFPATTEQEALDVLNQFKSKDNIFE